MRLIVLGNGIDFIQEGVEWVYVEFTDGTSETFVPKDSDAVILNNNEVKYINIDFREEQDEEYISYI